MRTRNLGRGMLWLSLILLAVGCSSVPRTPTPLPSAEPAATATAQATSTPTAVVEAQALPADADILQQIELDLDNDGQPERVVAYQQGTQVGLFISPASGSGGWSKLFPAGTGFTSLSARDLNADRLIEVLVETNGPQPNSFGLYVVQWQAGHAQLLAPSGGPLQGSESFASKYYPPFLDDFDVDTVWEIVVAEDRGDPHFVYSVIYQWDGRGFAPSELYLVAPRLVPAPTP